MSTKTISTDLGEHAVGAGITSSSLPHRYLLSPAYLISLLIAFLSAIASVAGLVYRTEIYPTEELQRTFLANDVVNLLLGLPILLVSMWLTRRGNLIGLLFWPGALFYGLYNYLVYLLGMPLNVMFLFYLAIVTLSIYTTIGLVAAIDYRAVKDRLSGQVPYRFTGALLILFGLLFLSLAVGQILGALTNQADISRSQLGLVVADFIFSPAWVVGGVLLWRRQSLGYVGGTGLLFQVSMLFVGLIVVLILQPLVGTGTSGLKDIIFLSIMSLISLIPLALFVRGVANS